MEDLGLFAIRVKSLLLMAFGLFTPILVFGTMADDVWDKGGLSYDRSLLLAIHTFNTPALDHLFSFITAIGSVGVVAPLVLIAVIWLWRLGRRSDAAFLSAVMAGVATLNTILKVLFHRTRPDLWVSIRPEGGYAFPSGHAMAASALATAMVILVWSTRWRWVVILGGGAFIIAVSLSRLYLGVHYPSDVIGAFTAGMGWVIGLHLVWGTPLVRQWVSHLREGQR
ncbi:MAG: phosphatase PAP2 family protein [Acidobacteriaceae bacterium]